MSIKVNGIKKITNLTAASTINDADVFMIETTSGTRKVTGATLKALINSATSSAADGVEAIIADEFDASLSYSVGDYVMHDGKLYRFTADHATGAFDGTDAVEVVLADELVRDVTVDGTSIVNNGVANVPIANNGSFGVVRPTSTYGVSIVANNFIGLTLATDTEIKSAGAVYHPIVPSKQHMTTFYGLAKAAGDTTQSQSANAVGTYTDEAKAAIKAMLDITGECQTVTVTGTTPVITATQNTRYVCGEVTSLDFTPSAKGICDVIFTSGSTVAVLTLPSTVILPSWFDATALEANTTYEISISDGVYGAVMVW